MIPSAVYRAVAYLQVYQRGLVIDSQLVQIHQGVMVSVSKGIGD